MCIFILVISHILNQDLDADTLTNTNTLSATICQDKKKKKKNKKSKGKGKKNKKEREEEKRKKEAKQKADKEEKERFAKGRKAIAHAPGCFWQGHLGLVHDGAHWYSFTSNDIPNSCAWDIY